MMSIYFYLVLINFFRVEPFFIGLPNLYQLMSNEHFTKLDGVADVKVGLQTGGNAYYLRKREGAHGSYDLLDEDLLLSDEQIERLTNDEKDNGVNPDSYGGRHFVPYDKGGQSNADGGWLPNYHVPTEYFIDWSEDAISRMRSYTIAQRIRDNNENRLIRPHYETQVAAVFRNIDTYFAEGVTFSDTGFYAPTFRLGCASVFDVMGMTIFSDMMSPYSLLAILASRLTRYLVKTYINHTVHTQVEGIKPIPIPRRTEEECEELVALVIRIVDRQKLDRHYPYYKHEQRDIDALVYDLYGLDENDIREVRLWFCRRYPRLAEAQGVLAEVKEQYADHLARCQRILEKPPSYWRSNPALELIGQGESHTLEFKETLQYNIHTNRADNDVLHSSLKTMAAFMNADGGTLLIGVSDNGEIKGLDRDIRSLGRDANNDRFELKIRNCISGQNSRFSPSATGNVNISFEELHEGTICRVDVQPLPISDVLHFDNDVFVRDGNHTLKLDGPELTSWIQRRANRPGDS